MSNIVMTHYPKTRPGQLKFDKCKKGDTVWFSGGYTIAGDWHSFGRRATVLEVRAEGPKGGVHLRAENDPDETYQVTWLITRDDILATLAQHKTTEEKNEFLALFQLQPGDLDAPEPNPISQPALASLSKKDLIARVQALETELAALKALMTKDE